jgi:hypothetical protein
MSRRSGAFTRVLSIGIALALSGCGVVEFVLPPGEARWAFAPDAEIGPNTTEFVAMVTEVDCASGQSSEGRIIGPETSVTDASITVTFRVRARVAGAQTCPSNPSTPVRVELPEPLGDRALLDGGTDPPREPPVCTNADFCE